MHNKKSFLPSQDFIYGVHTVMAVMQRDPKRCKRLFIARKDYQRLTVLAEKSRIPYELVDRAWLEKKYALGSDAQGVVLHCLPFCYRELDDLLKGPCRTLLVLDSWQDAANLGRAARAALCFGADGMIICKDRSASINAAAEKAAVGALAHIPVARVVNLSTALRKIKEAGFFTYGADEHGDVNLAQCDFASKAAVVIGQEGEGLRDLTKKHCDLLVKIPMAHEGICLNAADTALLFLYELRR